MRRILSIDPGYDRCGVAFIEKEADGSLSLLHSTCLTTAKTLPFAERLLSLKNELTLLIEEYKPNESALEKLFFTKNTKTALLVAESCGVIRVTLEELALKPKEYTPAQIKIAVTGYGNADKASVSFMVRRLIVVPTDKKLDDELDAIAVGITHAFTSDIKNLQ